MDTKVETRLAEFVTGLRYSDIPQEVIEFSKALMLKTVAGIAAGSAKPSGRKVAQMVRSHKAAEEVAIIKSGFKTSLWDAVFLHAYYAHASELEDDRYNGGVSWDITVIPLLLSLGEKLRLSGRAFTEALVVGLEAHTRTCLFGGEHLGLALIPGAVGPALAAARAMGLSREQATSAMGIAMSSAPTAFSNFGTDAHFLESSLQALQGIIAADMAKAGLTGNPDLATFLTGYLGADRVVPEKIVDQMGERWVMTEIWIKKYPCCFRMHRQVDILLDIMKKHNLACDEIASVEVPISVSDGILNRPDPRTEGDLQFSLQHVLGAAMLDGDINLENVSDEATADPRFADARRKVNIVTDPSLPRRSHAAPARLTVRTTKGEEISGTRMHPIGSPPEPLSKGQVQELYYKFARGVLSPEQLEKTADAIANLDNLGDITELTSILAD